MTEKDRPAPAWTIDYEGDDFERFYDSLPDYERAVLAAAIEHVLQVQGIDICAGEWGKALGDGLYEFRVRRSLQAILSEAGEAVPENLAVSSRSVLIRVFCTFYGSKKSCCCTAATTRAEIRLSGVSSAKSNVHARPTFGGDASIERPTESF